MRFSVRAALGFAAGFLCACDASSTPPDAGAFVDACIQVNVIYAGTPNPRALARLRTDIGACSELDQQWLCDAHSISQEACEENVLPHAEEILVEEQVDVTVVGCTGPCPS